MTDIGFRILFIVSAVLLVLAAIDVVRLIRARNAAGPRAEGDAKRTSRAGKENPRVSLAPKRQKPGTRVSQQP